MLTTRLTDFEAVCLLVSIPVDYSDCKSGRANTAHDARMLQIIPRYAELIDLFNKTAMSVARLKTGLEELNKKGLVEPYFETFNITPAGMKSLAAW
jgi:hypothetical protein